MKNSKIGDFLRFLVEPKAKKNNFKIQVYLYLIDIIIANFYQIWRQ